MKGKSPVSPNEIACVKDSQEQGRWGRYGVLCPAEEGDDDEDGAPEAEVPTRGSEETEEARKVRAPLIPCTPTKEEVEAHRLTHRPFRSWCPHCVRGKCRADQHRRSPQKGIHSNIPKLVSDYFFIGRRRPTNSEERRLEEEAAEKEGQTPIIVLKDVSSKAIFAHACPAKGSHDAVVNRIVADLENLGYNRVLVRTDGEPAILALWEAVKDDGGARSSRLNLQLETTMQMAMQSKRCRRWRTRCARGRMRWRVRLGRGSRQHTQS